MRRNKQGGKPLTKEEELLFIIQPSPGCQSHTTLAYFPDALFIPQFNAGEAGASIA